MIFDHELQKAAKRLWSKQEQFDCYPTCRVIINDFAMILGQPIGAEVENELRCTLDPDLLARILHREEHWNNAELGCHIMFERKGPYLPDVHTLLCFFHC